MKLLFISALSIILILNQGCSSEQSSNEVTAAHIPVSPYVKMSCGELSGEKNRTINRAKAAGFKVDQSYNNDKIKELVAWELFAPAALIMEGNQQQASSLASLKGQINAISDAQRIKHCYR